MSYVEAEVQQGFLRGLSVNGVVRFFGVPYGASTTGAHRFRPPASAPAWNGIRDAFEYGPAAPQLDPRIGTDGVGARIEQLMHPHGGSARNGGPMNENCLTLNIWAPSSLSERPRAVLVWMHGGGFTTGSGSETWYDGETLAGTEDLVVVTVTHRLGLFGFLDLRDPEVGGFDGSVNAGMLDLVAALQWIRTNIEQFGGDPACVTIAGQSGGGGKVAALTAMPAARGLYHRAIIQSGPIRRFLSKADTMTLRDLVFSVSDTSTASELQALPIADLLLVQQSVLAASANLGIDAFAVDAVPGLGPALDPIDLPKDAFRGDEDNPVPMIIGSTDHDMSLFLAAAPFFNVTLTDAQASEVLSSMAPDVGAQVYNATRANYPNEAPHLRLARAFSDLTFGPAIFQVADATTRAGGSTWMYSFGQTTDVLDGLLGSCHALDIAYTFGTQNVVPFTGTSPHQKRLADEMTHAWATFARTGVPTTSHEWQAWTSDNQATYRFGPS